MSVIRLHPNPLNGPPDGNKRVLHFVGNVRITASLSDSLEVVLQQAAETPQLADGCEVGVSGDRSAAKTFSSDVFRDRDAGNFCVLKKSLILSRTHANSAQKRVAI